MAKSKTLEKKLKAPCVCCPEPHVLEIKTSKAYHNKKEFSKSQLANAQNKFNAKQRDKAFVHTYRWKPTRKCCQVVRADVQIKFKALWRGRSKRSRDAGNDTIVFRKDGGKLLLHGGLVYDSHSFKEGEINIRSFTLTGNQLDWLNLTGNLSFRVQDDTAVLWVKIRLEVCCLSKKRSGKPAKK